MISAVPRQTLIPEFARLIPRFEPFVDGERFNTWLKNRRRVRWQIKRSVELKRHVETGYFTNTMVSINEIISPPGELPYKFLKLVPKSAPFAYAKSTRVLWICLCPA